MNMIFIKKQYNLNTQEFAITYIYMHVDLLKKSTNIKSKPTKHNHCTWTNFISAWQSFLYLAYKLLEIHFEK